MPRNSTKIKSAIKNFAYIGTAWTCASAECGDVTMEYRGSRSRCCGGCGGTSFTGFVRVYKENWPR